MPKDWKRYITAGGTFACIILIGFVMQNGQGAKVQQPQIGAATAPDEIGQTEALSQPKQEFTAANPAPAPQQEMAAEAPAAAPAPADSQSMGQGGNAVSSALAAELAAEAGNEPATKGETTWAFDLSKPETTGAEPAAPAMTDSATDVAEAEATGEAVEEIAIVVTPEAEAVPEEAMAEDAVPEGTESAPVAEVAMANEAPMQDATEKEAPVEMAALDPAESSDASVEMAAYEPSDTPAEPTLRSQPAMTGACEITMSAAPQAAALVDLALDAPCLPNERVTFHHEGMMFTETTDAEGKLQLSVPALKENATFIAAFANGEGTTADATVTSLSFYDRAIVQSDFDSGVGLHALEYGAGYDDDGHISAQTAGDISDAATGQGGFLMTLGNPDVSEALMAQVYSFPTGFAKSEGDVALSVEIEVTEANCGRDVDAQTLQAHDGALKVQTLELTMPDCDAVGDFLVLKNIVDDLRVASN